MAGVSIPFIAGQWSLHGDDGDDGDGHGEFQSPSLRGSGRFSGAVTEERLVGLLFQSPSLRGSGRFKLALAWQVPVSAKFQSPSLRGSGRFASSPDLRGMTWYTARVRE